MVSRYTTPEYHGDDVDGVLDYSQYSNCLYRTYVSWYDDSGQNDIIHFEGAAHTSKLTKGLRFDMTIETSTHETIVDIIKKYWDFFVEEGGQFSDMNLVLTLAAPDQYIVKKLPMDHLILRLS